MDSLRTDARADKLPTALTPSSKAEMCSIAAPMVHAACSSRQQGVLGAVHTAFMDPEADPVWRRVNEELDLRGRGWQWLADKIDSTIQRVQNWKTRGIPSRAHQDVANALGWTIDRLLGVTGPADVDVPSKDEVALLRRYRRLKSEKDRAAVVAYVDGLLAATRGADDSTGTSVEATLSADDISAIEQAKLDAIEQKMRATRKRKSPAQKTARSAAQPATKTPSTPRHPTKSR
jgi:hypothetical protein